MKHWIHLSIIVVLTISSVSSSYSEKGNKNLDLNESSSLRARFRASRSVGGTGTTYTTRTSWGQKIKQSFLLAILGAFLFLLSFPLLWYNERRIVQTNKLIKEGYNATQEISLDAINKGNEGNLVFATGTTRTDYPINDEEVNLYFNDTIKVHRTVKMYQLQENRSENSKRDTFGGGETTEVNVTYENVWSSDPIDSHEFSDERYWNSNPPPDRWFFKDKWIKSPMVHFGNFKLSETQIDQITEGQVWSIDDYKLSEIISRLKMRANNAYIGTTEDEIYMRFQDPNIDCIGDIKFSFTLYKNKDLSIVSEQCGSSFIPYDISKNGLGKIPPSESGNNNEELELGSGCACCGCCICCKMAGGLAKVICKTPTSIDWVYERTVTKKEAFQIQADINSKLACLLRFLSCFCMWLGIVIFFSPLYELLQILPLLSTLGVIAVAIIAFAICIPSSILVIALSWIFYRPLYGLLLIAVMIPFVVFLIFALKK